LVFAFLRQVFPYFLCIWIEWRLRRQIAVEEATPALNADMEEYISLDMASIESAHRLELERREQLRKNAQANLAAVTVALTFAFGMFGVMTNQYLEFPKEWFGWFVRGLGAFGVVSLLLSAISAVRALAPSRFYDMWLQTYKNSAGRQTAEGEKKAKLIKAIFLNQGHTLIIANHGSASSTGMRNGVVAIGITLLLMIACYSRPTGGSPSPAPAPTAAPAAKPSTSPAPKPTAAPAAKPSTSPAPKPTAAPATKPSTSPTP
jgi:hypothetical protein